MGMYAGFIPFRSEADWWANFADIAETCIRCERQWQRGDMDGLLCKHCRAQIEAAQEEEVDEDWSDERRRVEAWLSSRGL